MILMDVRMPTLNGYETAKLIRQRRQSALTPIIFVTALGGDEAEVATAYASGAVDFIFTPILPGRAARQGLRLRRSLHPVSATAASLEAITLHAALRDSDLATQAVLDNVSDGIFILDDDG